MRLVGFFTNDLLLDPTYSGTYTGLVTIAEAGMYFISACLLSLRPLAVKVWKTTGPYLSKASKTSKASKNGTSRRTGDKSSKHGGGDADAMDIPLDGRKKAGFERLSDDILAAGGGFYSNENESAGATEESKRGIAIHRTYEVV
jgi:hypothetical protein